MGKAHFIKFLTLANTLSKSNTLSNMVTKNHRFLCNHIYPKGLGPKGPWRECLQVLSLNQTLSQIWSQKIRDFCVTIFERALDGYKKIYDFCDHI
jgi:hypothetical protein